MDFANYVILRALNKPINFFRKDKNFWVKKNVFKKNVFEYVFFDADFSNFRNRTDRFSNFRKWTDHFSNLRK